MTVRKWLTDKGEKTKGTPPPEGGEGGDSDEGTGTAKKKVSLPNPKTSPRRLTRIELLALLSRETTEDIKGREIKGVYKTLLTEEFQ